MSLGQKTLHPSRHVFVLLFCIVLLLPLVSHGSGYSGGGSSAGSGDVSASGTPTSGQVALWTNATTIQGLTALPCANVPALTGDVTTSAGSCATVATANLARLNGTQTFTGTNTFTAPIINTITAPASTNLTLSAGSGTTQHVLLNPTGSGATSGGVGIGGLPGSDSFGLANIFKITTGAFSFNYDYAGVLTLSDGAVLGLWTPDAGTIALGTFSNHPVVLRTNNNARMTIGTDGSTTFTGPIRLLDTSAAFNVSLVATSSPALTAARTLTLNMGNVAHILSLGTTASTGEGIIFPNTATDTVAMLGVANVFSGVNRFGLLKFNGGSNLQMHSANVPIVYDGQISISTTAPAHSFENQSFSFTATSGAQVFMRLIPTFAPTSGSATFAGLSLLATINQTGGASGITRALYINPTVTAAADFRAIEVVTGGIFTDKLNGLTITSSTGALTIPNGVTLTGPAASGTAATLNGVETLTDKTFVAPILGTPTSGVATNLTGTAAGLTAATAWGMISGTLSDQTDLQSILDGKQSTLGYTPLNPANNLSDVGSATTSRSNLSAQLNLGLTAKTGGGTESPGVTTSSLTHGDIIAYDGSGTPTFKNFEPGPATNAQTGTSYAIVGTSATASGDKGKLVTTSNASPVAVSIAAAGGAGFDALFSFKLCSIGVGATTITPATSTIAGQATLVLYKGDCADINSDGANYHALVARDSIEVQLPVFDFTADVTTGDGKYYFLAGAASSKLVGKVLAAVQGQVITAGTTNTTDVQLARCAQAATGNACSGTVADMLSTKLTIDSGENTSATAATAAVINASNDDIAAGDVLRVDVDAISTTAPKGLMVHLIFRRP